MENGTGYSVDGHSQTNGIEGHEKTPLLGNNQSHHSVNYQADDTANKPQSRERLGVYKRRWYILILFSFTAFTQGATWNTWAPIADTVKAVLPGWTNADIGLLTNWGPIAYIITAVPFSWLMDVKGLFAG